MWAFCKLLLFLFIFLFLIFLFYFLCKFKAGRLFCNMCIDEWVGIWFVLVNFAVFVLLLSFIDFRVFFCFFIDVIRFRGIRDWYRYFFVRKSHVVSCYRVRHFCFLFVRDTHVTIFLYMRCMSYPATSPFVFAHETYVIFFLTAFVQVHLEWNSLRSDFVYKKLCHFLVIRVCRF